MLVREGEIQHFGLLFVYIVLQVLCTCYCIVLFFLYTVTQLFCVTFLASFECCSSFS
jgi:hypothetical protein